MSCESCRDDTRRERFTRRVAGRVVTTRQGPSETTRRHVAGRVGDTPGTLRDVSVTCPGVPGVEDLGVEGQDDEHESVEVERPEVKHETDEDQGVEQRGSSTSTRGSSWPEPSRGVERRGVERHEDGHERSESRPPGVEPARGRAARGRATGVEAPGVELRESSYSEPSWPETTARGRGTGGRAPRSRAAGVEPVGVEAPQGRDERGVERHEVEPQGSSRRESSTSRPGPSAGRCPECCRRPETDWWGDLHPV